MSDFELSKEAVALLEELGFDYDPSRTDGDYYIAMEDIVAEEDIRLAYDDPDSPRVALCTEIFMAMSGMTENTDQPL